MADQFSRLAAFRCSESAKGGYHDAEGAVFQPQLVELTRSILDVATAMLPEAKRTSTMRAEIASHILECAAQGERNPATLKTAALAADQTALRAREMSCE